jgi:glutathione peroxidase
MKKHFMKYIFALFSVVFLLSFNYPGDLYSINIKTIDGKKLDLSQFRGKKIVFIVIPLSSQDTTIAISQLSAVETKYSSSIVVIGVPSVEAGFKKGDEGKLKELYKDLPVSFIISEGMVVKKGNQQAPLFQWLTNKNKNRHSDQDVEGVGNKFFLDEKGELYAILGPRNKLTNPIIDKILSRPIR